MTYTLYWYIRHVWYLHASKLSWFRGKAHLVAWTHPFGGLNTPIWWPQHTHLVAWTHPFGGLDTPIWWPEHTHLVAWTHPFGGLDTPIWWPEHTHLVAWTHPFVFIISKDLANYISHLIILCSWRCYCLFRSRFLWWWFDLQINVDT